MYTGSQLIENPGALPRSLNHEIEGLQPVDMPERNLLVVHENLGEFFDQQADLTDFVGDRPAKLGGLFFENVHNLS